MDASISKNSSVESEPSSEAAVVRAVSEDEGEEVDDSESEVGWRQTSAQLKLYRFRPGPWISYQVPSQLLEDITNYPIAIRSQILSCISAVVNIQPQVVQTIEAAWGLAESDAAQEVPPDKIVPRFLWYQRELEKLYGAEAVREKIQDKNAVAPSATAEEDIEVPQIPSVSFPTPDVSAESLEADATEDAPSITPPLVDFATLKSPLIVRKKKKKIGVAQHIAMGPMPPMESTFGDASGALARGRMDRTDALSMTIRDMQFRLSRHGTVADPRSYMGKGDTAYDKDDPFFDDEDLMMEIGLTREDLNAPLSDASGEDGEVGDESEVSDDENGMDRLGEVYEGTEDLFFVDNFSEESEPEDEQPVALDQRGRKGQPARVLQTYPFPKPSSCPVVYNPRGWHKVKTSLSPILIAFFYTLECVVPSKRLPNLQRGIFDTAELALVDTSFDPPRLRLNDEGKRQVSQFLRQVLLACYSSFLQIFLPPLGPKYLPPVNLPRHCRVAWTRLEQLPEISAVLCHGFVDYDLDTPDRIESILKINITPYVPPSEELKAWWWAAVAYHTFRIFAAKEDSTMGDLDEFFERHTDMTNINERIKGWSVRMKNSAKMRASLQKADEKVPTPEDLKVMETELEADDEIFAIFDEISSGVIQYVISFNLRRNIFRDIFEAGELHLLKMFYAFVPSGSSSSSESSSFAEDVTDEERHKLEKALSVSWAARLVQLMEDSSSKFCATPIKPTASWLESRLRRFRKQIKVPNLYEKRKAKSQPKPIDGRSSPTRDNKKRRAEQRSSESLDAEPRANTPAPPSKKRKAEPPRSLVASLLKHHDLGRLLAILQMCPLTPPLDIFCRIRQRLDNVALDPDEALECKVIPVKFTLHSLESWDKQEVTDTENRNFASLNEALDHAETSLDGSAVFNSAVRDDTLRAWQAFEISTESAAFPFGQHTTGWLESKMSFLDLLCLHYWIQRLDLGEGDLGLVLTSVFVTQEQITSGNLPLRRLEMPPSIASNLVSHRLDLKPEDRIRAGQLALLAKRHANLTQLIRHKLVLPPWSSSFTRDLRP